VRVFDQWAQMDEQFQTKFLAAWQSRPAAEEINSRPAEETELQVFEAEFGPIPQEFRWFLLNCGGGVVGAEWVDDIGKLAKSHRKFRTESGPNGWTMTDVFVIGWDGWGNPFGIHGPTGKVLVEDHDFGGVHEMASSLAEFLSKGLEEHKK
jgi:hypothetical protein